MEQDCPRQREATSLGQACLFACGVNPGQPSAPLALKPDMQVKQTSLISPVTSGLSRRWPAWLAQRTPTLELGKLAKQQFLGRPAVFFKWGRPWAKSSENTSFGS
eukprot:563910-Pelagomonas_calceolata.AAC.3